MEHSAVRVIRGPRPKSIFVFFGIPTERRLKNLSIFSKTKKKERNSVADG